MAHLVGTGGSVLSELVAQLRRNWWLSSSELVAQLSELVAQFCNPATGGQGYWDVCGLKAKQSLPEGWTCVRIIKLNDFVVTIVVGSATKREADPVAICPDK